jgi:hypothetical protein
MTCDVGDSGDPFPLPVPPTPSQVIPVWREFERGTVYLSHIGVHFSDQSPVWRGFQGCRHSCPLLGFLAIS